MAAIVSFKDDVTTAAEAMERYRATKAKFYSVQPVNALEMMNLRQERDALSVKCREQEEQISALNLRIASLNESLKKALNGQPDIPDTMTCQHIQDVVCAHFSMPRKTLVSSIRQNNVVRPRMIAFFLCRYFTTLSLPQIGRQFGGKDHSTIFHGLKKVEPVWDLIADQIGGQPLPVVVRMLDGAWDKHYGPIEAAKRERMNAVRREASSFRSLGEITAEIVERLA
jgi:hypothetical protein